MENTELKEYQELKEKVQSDTRYPPEIKPKMIEGLRVIFKTRHGYDPETVKTDEPEKTMSNSDYQQEAERIQNNKRYTPGLKRWGLAELRKTFQEINGRDPEEVIEYAPN